MHQERFFLLVLLLLMIGTGFWLSRRGKPYSVLIQTIHKLIGAGGAFYAGYVIFPSLVRSSAGFSLWAMAVSAIISFLALIVTGGLLATEKQMPALVLLAHKTLPYLAVLLTGFSAYLVL